MNLRSILAATLVIVALVPVTGFAEVEETPDNPVESPAEQTVNDNQPLPVVRADINVIGALPETPAITTLGDDELRAGQSKDAGDLLREAPGVSSGRMGGHGLDPRVRGLGESSIRILIDGAEVHGGCPNRMDPPSSFAAVDSFDEVIVLRGVQTLRYGTAPGTVLFEREPIRFLEENWWQAGFNTDTGTNSDGPAVGFNASVGTSKVSLQVAGDRLAMDNYSDGDGEEVASAFDSRNGSIELGWTPDELTSLSLSYEVNRTEDALYAGAGMDSPFSDGDVARLKFRRGGTSGLLGDMSADVYWSEVEHLMDNYSLREWTAAMAMRAPSTSDSVGGRFWTDLHVADNLDLTVGVDIARNERSALRFAGPNPDNVAMLQSVLWPEVDLDQSGLFLEGLHSVGDAGSFRFGIRVDRHTASAGAADVKPTGMNPTPRQLWETYYDVVDDNWENNDVGGFVRYEHRLTRSGVGFFAGLSRTARAADTTQRFIASNNMMPAMRWVGNPYLDVAVHTQIDGGISWSGSSYSFDATVFYDDVDDEILRDRAHGQPGILRDDNATIYRNVEARRAGAEIVGRWRLGSAFTVGGDAAYVYAQNTTDDAPIAQTPPLEGNLFANWAAGGWGVSGIMRWASKQTRVDDNPMTGSGLDAAETPGWVVLDLSGEVDVGAGFRVRVGVDNVFDRTYAYHLNRDNFFDPDPIQINEPGRVFWLGLRWSGKG
ncbi:MAG: TonB-dependent copper receptor [Acidobacteria bacterium]|nr:MAG: TonB-dependent copper receptor [Acidobacteriota bacterium]